MSSNRADNTITSPLIRPTGGKTGGFPPRLFVGIDESILEAMLADCVVQNIAHGEVILTSGQENRAIHILLSGRLKIYFEPTDTSFIDIEPGECFGEMSIIDRKPVSAHVVAQENSQILVIHEDTFWQLVRAAPLVARNLLSMLCERIRIRDRAALQRMHERMALEKDLKTARAIQASLLTTDFDSLAQQGIDLFAMMNPVKEVGGDFYDAFFITKTQLFLCVGDVVGKGIPAALFMVRSLTELRMQAMREPNPGKIVERVNQRLCENNGSNMFLTLFCGIFNTTTGELRYANGGHNPPLCNNTETGEFSWIPMPDGTIVGIFETARYETASLYMKPGQTLLSYTDGVTEAMDANGSFFGEDHLLAIINQQTVPDAKKLIATINTEIQRFVDAARPTDDVTLLALRYLTSTKAE